MLAGIITRHLKRLIISYKGKLIPALILSTHSNDAFKTRIHTTHSTVPESEERSSSAFSERFMKVAPYFGGHI